MACSHSLSTLALILGSGGRRHLMICRLSMDSRGPSKGRSELLGQEFCEGMHLCGCASAGEIHSVDAAFLMCHRALARDIRLPIRQHRPQSALCQITPDQPRRHKDEAETGKGGLSQRLGMIGTQVAPNPDLLVLPGSPEPPGAIVRGMGKCQAIVLGEVCRDEWFAMGLNILRAAAHHS